MQNRTCPACKTELQPIKILDATSEGPKDTGASQVELSYSSPDAKQSFFLHEIKREGTVKAQMCTECGRILLYASPEN
jgi:hypothetical protein